MIWDYNGVNAKVFPFQRFALFMVLGKSPISTPPESRIMPIDVFSQADENSLSKYVLTLPQSFMVVKFEHWAYTVRESRFIDTLNIVSLLKQMQMQWSLLSMC